MEVKTEELTALQKRLEEKKRQRLQEQAAQRTGMSADSAQRTRSLINQKVGALRSSFLRPISAEN